MEGVNRNRCVLRHTAEENARAIVKTACIQPRFVMPLAHAVRSITRRSQKLRKRSYLWIHRVWRNVTRIGSENPKQTSSGQQHGPTRHTNSRRGRTHDVCMGQRCTRSCQRVKIWRRNCRRSQRTNRIVPMVIGNEKKEVGWHYRLARSMRRKVDREHSELSKSVRSSKNSAYRLRAMHNQVVVREAAECAVDCLFACRAGVQAFREDSCHLIPSGSSTGLPDQPLVINPAWCIKDHSRARVLNPASGAGDETRTIAGYAVRG